MMTPQEALEQAIKAAERASQAGLNYTEPYTRTGQLWVSIAHELRKQQAPAETPA